LATLQDTYTKQSDALRQIERQRDDLTAQLKTLEDTRATLEQSVAHSQTELAERQHTLNGLLQERQALTSQLG